jgi:regulatory protein
VANGCILFNMTRTITAIEIQKKDPDRVNIYLDGTFTIGVSAILATWLKVGQALTDEMLNKLSSEDLLESTYQKALHFLSYRPRSTFEVRKNLENRDLPSMLIEATIKRLENNALLDDQEFARKWVANRNDLNPRSRFALHQELRQKGLLEDIIQATLGELDDEILALQAARKYTHRLDGFNKPEFRKRLSNHLAGKGFSFDVINPVVASVWDDIQATSEHEPSIDDKDDKWT